MKEYCWVEWMVLTTVDWKVVQRAAKRGYSLAVWWDLQKVVSKVSCLVVMKDCNWVESMENHWVAMKDSSRVVRKATKRVASSERMWVEMKD